MFFRTPSSLQNHTAKSLKVPKNSHLSTPHSGYVDNTIQKTSSGKRASRAAALAAASAVAALDRDSDSPTPPPAKKIKQVITRSGRPSKSTYKSRSPSPPPAPTTSKSEFFLPNLDNLIFYLYCKILCVILNHFKYIEFFSIT